MYYWWSVLLPHLNIWVCTIGGVYSDFIQTIGCVPFGGVYSDLIQTVEHVPLVTFMYLFALILSSAIKLS